MSSAVETFLARLYTEADARARFLADAEREALDAGLGGADAAAVCQLDRAGLRMAAASFANKRKHHRRPRRPWIELFSQWWAKR